MFQNRQKVVVVTGGDPSRVIKVQAGTGDPSRVPVVTTDGVLGRDQQVQVVSGGDSTRFPILNGVNPILALSPAAYYPYATGITVTGSGVSQWDDASGNGRHLLQGTDGNRPAYSGGIITFDGVDNYLRANAFTLVQPEWVVLVFKQISWTSGDRIIDGNATNSGVVYQTGTTPTVNTFAGTTTPTISTFAIDSLSVLTASFNGASSFLRDNLGTANVANAGANNMGGLVLGAAPDGSSASNIAVYELAVLPIAPTDEQQTSVISYLMSKFSIT